jgi:hypothetical protein
VVTEVINGFLPNNRRWCRCIEVTAIAIPAALWVWVWWPGALAVGVLAALVWLA